jgi:hypothetical protein
VSGSSEACNAWGHYGIAREEAGTGIVTRQPYNLDRADRIQSQGGLQNIRH